MNPYQLQLVHGKFSYFKNWTCEISFDLKKIFKTNFHLILKSFPPEDGCAGAPTLSYGPPPLRIPILQKDEDDHDDDDDDYDDDFDEGDIFISWT